MKDELSTLHGDLRLLQRAREFDKSLTEIWDESVPCTVKYHGYDEARVSPEHEVVLLKENNKIVTVLNDTHNVTVMGDDFEEYLDGALDQNDDR